MSNPSPKKMLEEILKRAKLTPQEHEAMGDMWDRCHRYGRITRKQGAWIESVYYKQNLDKMGHNPRRAASPGRPKRPKGSVATVVYKGVDAEKCVTTMDQLAQVCPGIKPGSKQHAKIAAFFKGGGQVLKVKPPE